MLAYLVCLKTFSKNFTMPWRVPKLSIPLLCSGSGWCASTSGSLDELPTSSRHNTIWTQNPVREDLPDGWTSELDENGRLFYIHESGEITTERPGEEKKNVREWKDFKADVEKARAEKHRKANISKLSKGATKKPHAKRKQEFGLFQARKPAKQQEIELKEKNQV